MQKILEKITKLDDSKFKPIKNSWSDNEKLTQIYNNLWSMFNIKKFKRDKNAPIEVQFLDELIDIKPKKLYVNHFAWTKEVREQFYNHSYHKKTVEFFKTNYDFDWKLFTLDIEPSIF